MEKMEKIEKIKQKRSLNWEQDEKVRSICVIFFRLFKINKMYFFLQDILSQIVLDKLDIIENARIDTNSNKIKKETWNKIHTLFNSASKVERTLDQLQIQWRKIKSVAKTKNSSFLKQIRQTGGGPPPDPLNMVEEELINRLPKHFEQEYNVYDSNSIDRLEANEQTKRKSDDLSHYIQELLTSDDETQKPSSTKTRPLKDNEASKRLKLLEISITQKEKEMITVKLYSKRKTVFINKKR